MATVREVLVKWGFEVDDSGLKKATQGLNVLKKSVTAIGGAAVAGAATVFGMAKVTADMGDNAIKTAKSLGVTAQELQRLRFAADLGGVSASDFDNSLKKFSRTVQESRDGTETYTEALTALGLTSEEINDTSLSTEELLLKVSDAFKDMPDGVKKTAASMEVFGKSGAGLIPLLNEGGAAIRGYGDEAEALGIVIDEKLGKQSEAFKDALLRATSVLKGIQIQVGGKLIPIVTKAADTFREWALANKEIITSGIDKFMQLFIKIAKAGFFVFKNIFDIVSKLVGAFGGLEKVLTAVGIAFLVITGGGVLFGLGAITQGVFALAKSIKLLRIGLLLTNATALLIPILIGAAIVALALIIEDIIGFFTGKDSVTGKIVEAFTTAFPALSEFLVGVFDFLKEVVLLWFEGITQGLGLIKDVFISVFTFITDFLDSIFGGVITRITDAISSLGISGLLSSAGNLLSGGASSLKAAREDIQAAPTLSQQAGFGGGNTTTQNVNAPVVVNVPEGTPPDQVGSAVQKGVSDGLSRSLREASRMNEPQVAF